MHIIISQNHDAAYNMALEEYIYESVVLKQDNSVPINILLLWQNRNAVILGRNQDIYSECDMSAVMQYDVQIVRRRTGGGAVYHDLGNLNFSFIQSDSVSDRNKNFLVITQALKAFGIEAVSGGRNDLYVNDKKVSGNAFFRGKGISIHHGTLMVELNIPLMNKLLKAQKKDYCTSEINSVSSKVMNLKDVYSLLAMETLKQEIVKQFKTLYCLNDSHIFEDTDIISDNMLFQDLHKKHLDKNWIYGEQNRHTHEIAGRYSWGKVKVELSVALGRIDKIKIYSDALECEEIMEIQDALEEMNLPDLSMELAQGCMSELERDICNLIIQNV